MSKYISKIIISLSIIACFILFFVFDLHTFFSLSEIQMRLQDFLQFTQDNYVYSVLIFCAVYIFSATIALPIAAVLSLLAGPLFGFGWGTVLVLFSASTGSLFSFWLARYVIGDWVYKKFGHSFEKINTEIEHNGFNHMLFLRLMPIFPFFIINVAPAFTKLKSRTFYWASLLGMIPGSAIFVYTGQEIATITSVNDILSPGVITALVLMALLSSIPIVYKKLKNRRF